MEQVERLPKNRMPKIVLQRRTIGKKRKGEQGIDGMTVLWKT